MSRAVGITRPGGPEVLEVIDWPEREPAAGEVRIRVRYAAVNPTDIGLRSNGSDHAPAPWVPGMDAAGEVDLVGEGVTRLAPGDLVMAVCAPRRPEGGAQNALLVLPEASAVQIPAGVSLAAAATLPMNGMTALRGLELLGLSAGDSLAVSGGAGLLASYVIPLARERGLAVIADARPDEADLVRGYGADVVVERSEDLGAAIRSVYPDGVDGMFDTAVLDGAAVGAIRDGGGLAVVRGWEGPAPRGIAVHQVFVFEVLQRTEWLDHLAEGAADGRIPLHPLDEYPPERAGEAQEKMDGGGLRGRVLIAFGRGAGRARPA